jgi:hypothetical protein
VERKPLEERQYPGLRQTVPGPKKHRGHQASQHHNSRQIKCDPCEGHGISIHVVPLMR